LTFRKIGISSTSPSEITSRSDPDWYAIPDGSGLEGENSDVSTVLTSVAETAASAATPAAAGWLLPSEASMISPRNRPRASAM